MDPVIVDNIKIEVKSFFKGNLPAGGFKRFFFGYHVQVTNFSDVPVQLVRRSWEIYEGDGEVAFVEGSGVVGLQPILEPNKSFSYSSGCHLYFPLGKMQGSYLFKNLLTNELFRVKIPAFTLEVPFALN
ncbi:MAG: Co2+/Mg2+ efflux protein ApaG [Luteibaculaceae bacterium]